MTDVATMNLVVNLKDNASSKLTGISSKFDRMASNMKKSIGSLVKKFALLGVAAGGVLAVVTKNAVSTFATFEQSIANAASVTGATGEAFEAAKDNIEAVSRALGESTVFSATQAAEAFYDLASAGYDVANMTQSDLQPIMDLAAATQNDLATTTGVVTSALGQFGLGIEDSARVADVFAKTIGSSKATLHDLENSLKYVGPVANSMGISIEEVSASLGVLYNAGFKGEQAGTALRGAFSRLLNPTTAMTDKLAEMGLTIEDINPETHSFADVLDTLAAAGMSTADAMVLFGVEAAPAVLALTENTDGIRELEAALTDAGGAAETMARQQLDTLAGSIKLMKSALEGAAITIGGALAPYVRELVEGITKMIPVVMDLGKELAGKLVPYFDKLISRVSRFIRAIKNKLSPAFKSISRIVDSFKKIFSGMFDDMGGNEAAMMALTHVVFGLIDAFNFLMAAVAGVFGFFENHPVLTKAVAAVGISIALITSPVLALIAAVSALAYAWDTNWGGIKESTLKVLAFVSKGTKKYIAKISGYFKKFKFEWPTIPELKFPEILNPLVDFVKNFQFKWPSIPELKFPKILNPLVDFVKDFKFKWPTIPKLKFPDIINPLVAFVKDFKFEWPTIPELKFPEIINPLVDFCKDFTFEWPTIPELKFPAIINPLIDFVDDFKFEWPTIPDLRFPDIHNPLEDFVDGFKFEWPEIPVLVLPTPVNPLKDLFDGFKFEWPEIPVLELPTPTNPLEGLFDGYTFEWPEIPDFGIHDEFTLISADVANFVETITNIPPISLPSISNPLDGVFDDFTFTWPEIPVFELPVIVNPLEGLFDEYTFEWPEIPAFELPKPVNPLEGLFDDYTFEWPEIPAFELPKPTNPFEGLFDDYTFEWPEIPAFEFPALTNPFKGLFDDYTFTWPEIPTFTWPTIPTLVLPPVDAGSLLVAKIAVGALIGRLAELNAATFGARIAWETNFGGIRDAASGDFSTMSDSISNLVDAVTTKLQPTFAAIASSFNSIITIAGHVAELIDDIWTALSKYGVTDVAMTVVMGAIAVTGNAAATALNTLSTAIAGVLKYFAEHPTLTKFAAALVGIYLAIGMIATVVGTLTAVSAAISGLAAAIAAAGGLVAIASGAIATALGLINLPLLALILVIAALAIAWDENWGGIQEKTAAATQAISEHLDEFLGGVSLMWTEYGPGISAAAAAIWDGVAASVKVALTAVQTAINVGMSLVQGDWEGAWEKLAEGVSTVGTIVVGYIDAWGPSIVTAISGIGDSIGEQIGGGWGEAISSSADALALEVDALLLAIKTTITVGMALLQGDWDGAWNALVAGVPDVLSKVGEAISTAAGDWPSKISGAVGNFGESISSAGGSAITAATGLCNNVKDAIVTAAGDWSAKITDAVGNFGTAISSAVEGVVTAATGLCNNVKDAIVTAAGDWPTKITEAVGKFGTAISSSAEGVVTAATGLCGKVKTAITTAAGDWPAEITTAVGKFGTAISSAAEGVVTAATGLCGKVKTAITTAAGDWPAEITTAIGKFGTAISSGAEEVVTAATELCGKVKTAITNAVAGWVTPITDILGKIASAVTSGGKTVTTNNTTWCDDSTTAITTGSGKWTTPITDSMGKVAAAVTTGGKTATTNNTTWCNDSSTAIETGSGKWTTKIVAGMGKIAAAVTTGGKTAVTNTGTWCSNVTSTIGTGGTNWISKMNTGMGGVVAAITSGGVSAVTSTKLWTASAGGVIDNWAAEAQSSITAVGNSIDAMNRRLDEQQRERDRLEQEHAERDERQEVETPASGMIIISAGEGDDYKDAAARGVAAGSGDPWSGRSQAGLQEVLSGISGDLWFTESAWSGLSSEMQDELRSMVSGIVSDDYSTITQDFRSGASGTTDTSGETEDSHIEGEPEVRPDTDREAVDTSGFAEGGYIPYDMTAKVHAGEFVVPRQSVDEFLGRARGTTVNNTYNIGNVYGVNDLNRLLAEHDRKLVRTLRGLV